MDDETVRELTAQLDAERGLDAIRARLASSTAPACWPAPSGYGTNSTSAPYRTTTARRRRDRLGKEGPVVSVVETWSNGNPPCARCGIIGGSLWTHSPRGGHVALCPKCMRNLLIELARHEKAMATLLPEGDHRIRTTPVATRPANP